MKRVYIVPTVQVVKIQQAQLVCASNPTNANANLDGDEAVVIDPEPAGNGFVGRSRETMWDDEEE